MRRCQERFVALTFVISALLSLVACGNDTVESQSVQEASPPTETSMEKITTPVDADAEAARDDVFAYEPARRGGVLILAGAEPDTLYRYGGNMTASLAVLDALHDPALETLDYDYQAVAVEHVPRLEEEDSGALLELVTVSPGERFVHPDTQDVVTATETVTDVQQLTVRFEFRDGLTWEDGTEVTADDSVFARNLACHPDTPKAKDLCDRTAHYEAIDDRTVEWQGLPGYVDQTYHTNVYAPLPRHQVGSAGTRMDETAPGLVLEDEVYTRRPYSYGPFKLAEWVAGDHIALERNPYYWRSDEGLPFLDRAVFKFATDPNSVLVAVKSGDIDVAGLSVDQLDALEAAERDGTLRVQIAPTNSTVVVAFNSDPVDERVPLAACRDLRRALTLAHDRETVVDVIGRGEIDVLHSFVPPNHWAAPPPELTIAYDYDPEAAASLLSSLGFEDEDGDGVREAVRDVSCPIVTDAAGSTVEQLIPAGTRLELRLSLIAGDPLVEEWGLLFQQHMADVGVDVDLEFLAGQVLLAKGPDGPLLGRRFDLGAFSWVSTVQPPTWLYYCDQIPSDDVGWSGLNVTGWCDPEYQRLGMAAAGVIGRVEALPLMYEAQRIYMEELPAMPLCTWPSIVATTPEVVNVRPNPSVNTLTWNIATWGFAE